jgi:hypothetical protein
MTAADKMSEYVTALEQESTATREISGSAPACLDSSERHQQTGENDRGLTDEAGPGTGRSLAAAEAILGPRHPLQHYAHRHDAGGHGHHADDVG